VLIITLITNRCSACNQAGECFLTNDAAPEFEGKVSMRLINVQTGVSAFVQLSRQFKLEPGAGVVSWFCAATAPTDPAHHAGSYRYYPCQAPAGGIYHNHSSAPGMTQTQCQAACDASSQCLGFTRAKMARINGCIFYSTAQPHATNSSAFGLGNALGDALDWWQKGTVPPFPNVPPVIPTCVVPEKLPCANWRDIREWTDVGCLAAGENCVVELTVTSSGGQANAATSARVSQNLQLFVPPKQMQLLLPGTATPSTTVTAAVVDTNADANEVQLSVRARGGAGLALFVSAAVILSRSSCSCFNDRRCTAMTFVLLPACRLF